MPKNTKKTVLKHLLLQHFRGFSLKSKIIQRNFPLFQEYKPLPSVFPIIQRKPKNYKKLQKFCVRICARRRGAGKETPIGVRLSHTRIAGVLPVVKRRARGFQS